MKCISIFILYIYLVPIFSAQDVSIIEYKHKFSDGANDSEVTFTYYEQEVKWDEADATCKVHDGYLMSSLNRSSPLYTKLKNLGIDMLWAGIHRKENFYMKDYYPYLFTPKEEKSLEIDQWIEGEDFLHDCVVLSLKNKTLKTQNCSLDFTFVCESKGPLKINEDCPEAWYLSPPLSVAGRICISVVKDERSYKEAENYCNENESRLASIKEYRILKLRNQLRFKKDDQEFWAQKENNSACSQYFHNIIGNRDDPSCEKPLPFVCVKSMEPESLDVNIEAGTTQDSVDTFQFFLWNSTCDDHRSKHLFFCGTKSNFDGILKYQWFRDNIPVEEVTEKYYFLKVKYLSHSLKWHRLNTDRNVLQGSYHCELRLQGSVKTYRSQEISFFYSDVATYIIDIRGIDQKNYIDYSHSKFYEKMEKINDGINKILGEVNAAWDFKSIQKNGDSYSMKLLVYKNRTSSFNDEKVYEDITRKFKENISLLQLGENVELSVHSADVCFPTDLRPYDKCEEIKWPTTKLASNVLTETTCINEQKKFMHRECKGSTLFKAEWSPFDCSQCKEFLKRYQDKAVQCPNGYHRLNSEDICFKIYHEKKNWYDAYKTCSDFSSYLLDIPHESYIGNVSSIWLSFKYAYGKIQGFGQKPITLKALYEKEEMLIESNNIRNHELYCISTVRENSGLKLKFSNCNETMAFVCVQKLYELVKSTTFENSSMYKQNNVESCYYLEEHPHIWDKANEFCEENLHGAKLLSGALDIDSYSHLKNLIIDQYANENECDAKTWWMDFEDVIQNGMPPNFPYVDWGPSANFNISMPHGVITLFPDKKVYWSLENSEKKLGFICQVQKCFNIQPTPPSIEKKSYYETNGTENTVVWLNAYYFNCIPNGWYIAKSISWYKDNILFDNVTSKELSFHNFPNMSELKALELQGDYSCSVDMVKNKEVVYSSKLPIRIPGFYTFAISMVTEADRFLDECSKYILSNALYETTALYQCFNEHWKDTLKLNEFHFHLKNATCYRYYVNITVHLYFKNHLPELEITKRLQEADFSKFCEACNIDHQNITVKSTEFCYSEKMSLKNIDLEWPTTKLGKSSFSEPLCSTNAGILIERTCMGDFSSGTFWSDVSATNCSVDTSPITEELFNILKSENVTDYLPYLLNMTSDPTQLKPSDVQVFTEILGTLAGEQNTFPSDKLFEVVESVSNLIDIDQEVLSEAANSTMKIVGYLEKITSHIDEAVCNRNISTKNVHVNVYSLRSNISIPNSVCMSKSVTFPFFNSSAKDLQNSMPDFDSGLVIPQSLLQKKSNTSDRLVYFFLENLYFQENISVLSSVITVSFLNTPVVDLEDENISLIFRLKLNLTENEMERIQCAFWNEKLKSWSLNGCDLKSSSNNSAFCMCNHLTSFAVIMVREPPSDHHSPLLFITYIGSSLSCVGLALIILTFVFFREWRDSVKNKCLCNFSLSYFLFLAIYMAGIEKTDSRDWCKVIAVLLHYLLLCSFMWMIVLAYTVYLSLVKVLPFSISHFIQKAMAFAWGIPAGIVVSVLSGNYNNYFGENFCWCSKDVFTYGIMIPMIVMLIVNYLIFGMILYVNICGMNKIKCNQDKRKLLMTRTKALLCISCMLGLAWIFLIFAMETTGELHLTFTYLFTFATASQGVFLALFFILLPRKPRQLWIKLLSSPKAVFKSHSHVSSSFGTNHATY